MQERVRYCSDELRKGNVDAIVDVHSVLIAMEAMSGCPVGQLVVPSILFGEFQMHGLIANNDTILRAVNNAIAQARVEGDIDRIAAKNNPASCSHDLSGEGDKITLQMMRGLFYIILAFLGCTVIASAAKATMQTTGVWRRLFPKMEGSGPSPLSPRVRSTEPTTPVKSSSGDSEKEANPSLSELGGTYIEQGNLEADIRQIAEDLAELREVVLDRTSVTFLGETLRDLNAAKPQDERLVPLSVTLPFGGCGWPRNAAPPTDSPLAAPELL